LYCAAITKGGTRCRLDASYGSYCFQHSPQTAGERKQRASKGGRAGGNGRSGGRAGGNGRVRSSRGEITEIKDLLKDLTERVLAGDLLPGPASVANQLQNTHLRAVEQERKNKETEDLEERLTEVERIAREQHGGRGRAWHR